MVVKVVVLGYCGLVVVVVVVLVFVRGACVFVVGVI